MEYNMYFDYNDTTVRLPVLPKEIDIKYDGDNKTTYILGLGQINILNNRKLSEISFESFFPYKTAPYVVVKQELPPPKFYVEWLNSIVEAKKPVRFVLTGLYEINMLVSIEKFSIKEKGGEPGDIYYDISLKEYKEYKAIELNVTSTGTTEVKVSEKTERVPKKTTPNTYTYTVKSGDSLWKIAKSVLSDGSKWTDIAELNKLKAPYTIYPGQILKMPS